MPSLSRFKILLVQSDGRLVESLVRTLLAHFDAELRCVAGGVKALDREMIEPHDIIIADLILEDMYGLDFIKRVRELNPVPLIVIAESPSNSDLVECLRLGVDDVLIKPANDTQIVESVERLMRSYQADKQSRKQANRNRNLVRMLIRERRRLNQQIDILCRDLVEAHRELVEKFMDRQDKAA